VFKNKIVHIIILDKFIPPFIDFINKHFDANEHLFVILGKPRYKYGLTKEYPVMWIDKPLKFIPFLKELNQSKKIIIHGLWSEIFNIILLLQPWLFKKCYWIIWGGDLYSLRENASPQEKLRNYIKKSVTSKLKGVICYHNSEFEVAKKLANVNGEFLESFFYPSNLYKDIDVDLKPKSEFTIIQVGNSADPSNEHVAVFEKLKKFKDENIKLVVPLSYGDEDYTKEVVQVGYDIFGDKFYPLLEFMDFKKYLKLLSEIDIAIFNHDRQQAMGNITTLLGLGKKVYLRKDVITWNYLTEVGVKVFDVESINLNLISGLEKQNNIHTIKKYFSLENLVLQWKKIIEDS